VHIIVVAKQSTDGLKFHDYFSRQRDYLVQLSVSCLVKISWEIWIIRSCQLEHLFSCSLILDAISLGIIVGTGTPLTVYWILRDMAASPSGLWFSVFTMIATPM
jgi:hypothetical protein